MNENIRIHKATHKDLDFIVDTIIEAEKSGTEKISYCNIFEINESDLRSIIRNILEEDIEGQELCLSGFMVAESEGKAAGAVCSWVEAKEGSPSSIIKASILHYFIKKENLEKASSKKEMLELLNIEREPGTIQIESVYVHNNFRGMGVSGMLVLENIKKHLCLDDKLEKVQIQLAGNNDSAFNSYRKLGFEIKKKKVCDNKKILDILPSDSKVLMEVSVEWLKVNKIL
jgi:ribosomal protein S18 acetylase RimI-like enzyme